MRALDEKQQLEMKQIMCIPKVGFILNLSQLALFSDQLNLNTLATKIAKKIKHILRREKNISREIHANLAKIIKQILVASVCQRAERVNYLVCYLIKIYRNVHSQAQIITPEKIAANLIKDSLTQLGFEGLSKDFEISKHKDLTQELKNYQSLITQHDFFYDLHRFLGLAGMIYCSLLMVFSLYSEPPATLGWQIKNFAYFMGAFFYYSYMSNFFVNYTLHQAEQKTTQAGLPDYKFDQIDIVMCQNYKLIAKTYAPNFSPVFLPEAKSELAEPDSLPTKGIKHKMQGYLTEKISSALPQKLTWPRKQVIFGKLDEEKSYISQTETTPMQIIFAPKNIQYWGFLNKHSLSHQGLQATDREWKNYEQYVQAGRVVPPNGHSGIKQLNPRIMTRLKIAHHDFGDQIFSFSVKKLGVTYRLLGRVCDTKISQDGTQHKLVDYCWHWPKGPGH